MQADPALAPHRHGERRHELLDQHEGRGVADPAAGLAALGDDPDGAGRDRGAGLGQAGHLGQHRPVAEPRDVGDVGDDHRADPPGQLVGGDRAAVRNPDGGAIDLVAQRGQRVAGPGRIAAEFEHAQRAGGTRRGDQPGVRAFAR